MKRFLLVLLFFVLLPLRVGGGAFALPWERLVLIDDPEFVRLVAVPNPDHRLFWATDYVLEVEARNPAQPVEVSYLILAGSATPEKPSQGVEVRGNTFIAGWEEEKQLYFHTEVGGWARPEFQANPQYFPLPHYRTCVLLLARYEKVYLVFLRENDGYLTYRVFRGGPFTGLEVDGLARVTRVGEEFEVRSLGGPVEVGLWAEGAYLHDEVAGYARPEFQENPKRYRIPHYGMFFFLVARYGRIGLIVGNENDGYLGAVTFSGSRLLQEERLPGLGTLRGLGGPEVEVLASEGVPVEVSHFSFDGTCWQHEVGGWARPEFEPNPQRFSLKHYTPGFLMLSRYEESALFCYNENDGQLGILPLVGDDPDLQAQVVAAQGDFGFRLFSELLGEETGNVALSPFGLFLPLAVVCAGACGETQKSMALALGLTGLGVREVQEGHAGLLRHLHEEDPGVSLHAAYALWVQEGLPVKEEFLSESRMYYGAEVENLDFTRPEALEVVNGWVREHTKGTIEQILERIDPETLVVVTSAVFFRGAWTVAFERDRTAPGPFVLPGGGTKTCPFMTRSGVYRYLEGEDFQAVAIPYGKEGRFSMYLFLPDFGVDLEDFIRSLSWERWEDLVQRFREREGTVSLPRFRLAYGAKELRNMLRRLGMGPALAPGADFCNLLGGEAYISSVVHRAFVEVNEEGTEASAASAVVVSRGMGEPFTMVVNRPFFFAIRDDRTGTLLFLGAVFDPEGEV
ncbi:serpin family protein [Candidatus Caldatribacterium sp. SIUC1]|uniref:serpin family protein n=1 Tax=Candidatus Caldatribacterium sp. SIUC1 TaxID=3418365 RepID=UPI003F68E166